MKQQIECERKFLIRYPNREELLSYSGARESDIEQIYLESDSSVSRRIRKRTENGKTVYTKNEKIRISEMSRIEKEGEISCEEYLSLKKEMKKNTNPIIKKRIVIPIGELDFEIDIFPFWSDRAFMEVELASEEQSFDIPPFVTVIKEVTNDRRYTNHSLSVSIPADDVN